MSEIKTIPAPESPEHELEQRFVQLIERTGPRIRRVCRSWAGAVDADDLEAEVFLQLWRSLPTFAGDSSVDTWAYRVTVNTAMAVNRRERLGAQSRDQNASVDTLAVPSGAQATLEQAERRGALHRAVAKLSDPDQSMMALWFEELPYSQIAEVMGLSENHIGVRIHRIKQKLSVLMGPTATPGEATP